VLTEHAPNSSSRPLRTPVAQNIREEAPWIAPRVPLFVALCRTCDSGTKHAPLRWMIQ
jgi:hypothetical protein